MVVFHIFPHPFPPHSAGAFRVYPKSMLTNILFPGEGFCIPKLTSPGKSKKSTNLNMEETMSYTKPQVLAQNASAGSYAAGCPANGTGGVFCKMCDRVQ